MMRLMAQAGMFLAMLLIGIGAAVLVKTISQVGFDRLALGHLIGPGLIAAGIARIKLQRMLGVRDRDAAPPAGAEIIDVPRSRGGDDDGEAT